MSNIYKNNRRLLNIIIVTFVSSLALGTFNPFVKTDSEDGGLGIAALLSVVLVPLLYSKYKGQVLNNIAFSSWQKPLIAYFIISFIGVLLMASSITIGLIIAWTKLLTGIYICLLFPIVFRNNKILYISLLAFSILCTIICVLVIFGFLNNYLEINNGRLLLWGENPNSTSTRWVLAVIYIAYIAIENPLGFGKLRFLLLLCIFPMFYMIMLSGSRGSFLIAIVGLALCFFTEIKKRPGISFVLMLLAACAIYYVINHFDSSSYSLFDRFATSLESDEEDIRSRLMKSSWKIFCDYPILGIGHVDYLPEMHKLGHKHIVHNLYMHILTVNGIVGFIPFIVFNYRLLRGAMSVVKKNSLPFILLCYMMLIASKTGGILTYLFMWFVLSLSASLVNNIYENNKS